MGPDELEIRRLVEGWAVWRDAMHWERFRTVWHADGRMMATWWQGPFEDFIAVSREGYARGVRILHFLGGSAVDVAGERAIAQTKMTIAQRAVVEDVECDVVCTGRFYDFFARRDGRWGLVLRQPIYERDRLDPVDPARAPALDRRAPGRLPGRLSPPRLPAGGHRLRRQARHARPGRPGGRAAVRRRRRLAGRGAAEPLSRVASSASCRWTAPTACASRIVRASSPPSRDASRSTAA